MTTAKSDPSATDTAKIDIDRLTLGYERVPIVSEVSTKVPAGSFTVIVGPNACGKSTLLRGIARLLPARSGSVLLDGRAIADLPTRRVAQELGLLPQTSIAPEGIRVADLVGRGRYPRQGMFDRWSAADEQAVIDAMAATGVSDLSGRLVDELSGGQRQRVWVAMVLAQETDLVLLDEPTTFLDIAAQYSLLDLCRRLQHGGRTMVAVLHDLNQAARFASHLIVMKAGEIVAEGTAAQVLRADVIQEVFELPCQIISDPVTNAPLVIPLDPSVPAH